MMKAMLIIYALRQLKELTRARTEVLIAYPILLESYSLLLFRLGRNAASGWLNEISGAALVNPAPEDYVRAFTIVQSLADQRITLVDATLAALAARLRLEVWTYDHHFDAMQVRIWR
jgi:predicted nucleic acid-binding protein